MAEFIQVFRNSPAGEPGLTGQLLPERSEGSPRPGVRVVIKLQKSTLALFACSENEQALELPD
ncbi:hypothetical protein GC163_23820 [bacterium]|nr:hypothetical protein [bacterium]